LEVLSQGLFADHADLDLPLDHGLVEGDRVFVLPPNCLKVKLGDDCDGAHDGDDQDDQICEVVSLLNDVTTWTSGLKLCLPLSDGESEANQGEEGDENVEILPQTVIVVVFGNQLAPDGVIAVVSDHLVEQFVILLRYFERHLEVLEPGCARGSPRCHSALARRLE